MTSRLTDWKVFYHSVHTNNGCEAEGYLDFLIGAMTSSQGVTVQNFKFRGHAGTEFDPVLAHIKLEPEARMGGWLHPQLRFEVHRLVSGLFCLKLFRFGEEDPFKKIETFGFRLSMSTGDNWPEGIIPYVLYPYTDKDSNDGTRFCFDELGNTIEPPWKQTG